MPPCPTLADANRFELSRRFHSPASLRSFTVSNGPGFREQEQPSVLPLSSALNTLYLPGLPSLCFPGCQPDRQPSGFPALSASYCACQRRRSPCRAIATLTHFWWFQCCEIPKPVTYPAQHFNELPINNQRLSTALTHSTQRLQQPPLHA